MAKNNRAVRHRIDFAKIPATIQIPNLIEVQKRPSERDDTGLQAVFTSVFPIMDFRNVSQLDFVDYAIGNWECKCGHLKGLHHLRTTCPNCGNPVGLQLKYDVNECEERGMTYSAPLKVTIRLTIFDKDVETGNRSIRDIKEQEVFFGDVPLMTD